MEYLQHYGIKGQKWGVRRFQNEDGTLTAEGKGRYGKSSEYEKAAQNHLKKIRNGGPTRGIGSRTSGVYDNGDGTKDMKRLKKDAHKDAEDMARAKAYYGEGAGNSRKQIRNRISERMKDPDYKAEYEKHLAAQDMSKHQKAANRERKMEDTKKSAAKIGRGIKNLILGVGTTSLAAISLYNAAKMVGADKKIAEFGKKALNTVISKAQSMKKPKVSDYNWQANRTATNTYSQSRSSSNQSAPRRDFVEKNDRAKHGTQRPWIDEHGNIHYK